MNLQEMLAKQKASAAQTTAPAAPVVGLKLNLGAAPAVKNTENVPAETPAVATAGTVAQSASPMSTAHTAQPVQPAAEVESPPHSAPASAAAELDQFNHPTMLEQFTPEAVDSFRDSIQMLRDSFEHPELVANATRNILITLRENPNFIDILLPEDYGLMVRGLRESYGQVATSKTVNKEKRASAKSSIAAVADFLGDIEIDLT